MLFCGLHIKIGTRKPVSAELRALFRQPNTKLRLLNFVVFFAYYQVHEFHWHSYAEIEIYRSLGPTFRWIWLGF